jgi:hypothetical protein
MCHTYICSQAGPYNFPPRSDSGIQTHSTMWLCHIEDLQLSHEGKDERRKSKRERGEQNMS